MCARVTLSGIITDINGSVGGWTFQNSLSGKIVRTKPARDKKPIVRTPEIKIAPGIGVLVWNFLTAAQQDDWNVFAAATPFTDIYGNTKTLSGYQFCTSCFLRQAIADVTTTVVAPVAPTPPDVMEAYTLFADNTKLELQFAANWNHPNDQAWIFLTYPSFASSLNNRSLFRLATTSLTNNATTFDLTAQFEGTFNLNWTATFNAGRFYVMSRIFLMRIDTGICSLAVYGTAHT